MKAEMPDNLVQLTQQGRPTDPAVKEDAFRLWVQYGRSVRLVSRQMNIEERTLFRWRNEERWEERRKDEAAAFLPGMFTESAIAARMAAHSASVRLQQIMYEAEAFGTKPDIKEVQALTLAMDRGGFSPTGTKGAPQVKTESTALERLPEIAALSDDELERLEQSLLHKRKANRVNNQRES